MVFLSWLEKEQDIPDGIDLTFFRQCFGQCLQGSRIGKRDEKTEHLCSVWNESYLPLGTDLKEVEPLLAPEKSKGLGQTLTEAALQYMSNCRNHIKLNFYRRWFSYISRMVTKQFPVLHGKLSGKSKKPLRDIRYAIVKTIVTNTMCSDED